MNSNSWKTLSKFFEIRSPWMTLIGERIQDHQDKILDYWRIEKADSAIVLPLHKNKILMPMPMYRPGLGTVTLDFPGGRVAPGRKPDSVVVEILERELGVKAEDIETITGLNSEGWAINSSFSNQKLYGFVAKLAENKRIDPENVGVTYPITNEGFEALLKDLMCLQCRAVLLEWLKTI